MIGRCRSLCCFLRLAQSCTPCSGFGVIRCADDGDCCSIFDTIAPEPVWGDTLHSKCQPRYRVTFALSNLHRRLFICLLIVLDETWLCIQVLDTDHTVPKCCLEPCCCCLRCPWHRCSQTVCNRDPKEPTSRDQSADGHFVGEGHIPVAAPVVEEPSQKLVSLEAQGRCVKVDGLVKRFNSTAGIKTAVNKLNLTMFEGQVTALLGHNGAGKTTTISMLTGMLRPTEGSMKIMGMDLSNEVLIAWSTVVFVWKRDSKYYDVTRLLFVTKCSRFEIHPFDTHALFLFVALTCLSV